MTNMPPALPGIFPVLEYTSVTGVSYIVPEQTPFPPMLQRAGDPTPLQPAADATPPPSLKPYHISYATAVLTWYPSVIVTTEL